MGLLEVIFQEKDTYNSVYSLSLCHDGEEILIFYINLDCPGDIQVLKSIIEKPEPGLIYSNIRTCKEVIIFESGKIYVNIPFNTHGLKESLLKIYNEELNEELNNMNNNSIFKLCNEEEKKKFKPLFRYLKNFDLSDLLDQNVFNFLPGVIENYHDKILMRDFLEIMILPYLEALNKNKLKVL